VGPRQRVQSLPQRGKSRGALLSTLNRKALINDELNNSYSRHSSFLFRGNPTSSPASSACTATPFSWWSPLKTHSIHFVPAQPLPAPFARSTPTNGESEGGDSQCIRAVGQSHDDVRQSGQHGAARGDDALTSERAHARAQGGDRTKGEKRSFASNPFLRDELKSWESYCVVRKSERWACGRRGRR